MPRYYCRRHFSKAPSSAFLPPTSRLATGSSDDNTNRYGKRRASSSSWSPLHATANTAPSENPKAKTAKASAEAAKAAAALLLASSPKEEDACTTNAATLRRVNSSRRGVLPKGADAASTTATSTATPSVSDAGPKPADVWRARLALTLTAFLYGTNYATIKYMGGLMDISSLLTLRFALAALALLPALQGAGKGVILAGAEVGVYATLGYGAQAYAMTSLPASELALLASLAVVVPPLADQISGRRQAGVATICAALLACGGAALLQSGDIEVRAVDQATGLLPHALALMAPFFFGLCTWRMEAHVQTHHGKALPLTASQLVVVAVMSALLGIVSGGFSGIPAALANPGTDPLAWGVLVWLGLINTALVLFLETKSLESVSAAEATVIQSLEPLVGAGLASSTLGEPVLSPLGASLVIGGCLCSSLSDSSTLGDNAEQQEKP
eukprot:g10723.t1